MTDVLLISSSALGEASISNKVTAELVAELRRGEPDLRLVKRDVGANPLPHLEPARMPALAGKTDTPPAAETAALSQAIVDEVKAADLLVIGSPMYNFGITSTLKVWFDHLLRAGMTFRYTAAGSEGLLSGKRAIVVEARGGVYSEGPSVGNDHQEAHLRTLLGFIGITDVTFVRVEKLAISPEDKEKSVAAALVEAREVASRFAPVAA